MNSEFTNIFFLKPIQFFFKGISEYQSSVYVFYSVSQKKQTHI